MFQCLGRFVRATEMETAVTFALFGLKRTANNNTKVQILQIVP